MKNIKFLLVGKVNKSDIVYEKNFEEIDPNTLNEARNLFIKHGSIAPINPNSQNKSITRLGFFYYTIISSNFFYLALANINYDENAIYELFQELNQQNLPFLVDENGQLTDEGKIKIEPIFLRFENRRKMTLVGASEFSEHRIVELLPPSSKGRDGHGLGNDETKELNPGGASGATTLVVKTHDQQIKDENSRRRRNIIIYVIASFATVGLLCAIIIPLAVGGSDGQSK